MYPGERDREVTVKVIDDARVFPLLREGVEFDITEGPSSVVGKGIVLSVQPGTEFE